MGAVFNALPTQTKEDIENWSLKETMDTFWTIIPEVDIFQKKRSVVKLPRLGSK